MPQIKTLIVDDETNNIEVLSQLIIEYCPTLELVATAKNIDEAYKAIKIYEPQLVLLDIEMPNGNGFDLLNRLHNINFSVIFVTAYNNYAIKAIKYAAVDYIVKPVCVDELQMAVEKVTNLVQKKDNDKRIENLLHTVTTHPKQIQRITIPTHDSFVFEDLENIIYLQASQNYTHLYTQKNYKIVSSKNIKEFEEILPSNIFCRVHNSFIVNINFVVKFNKIGRGGTIQMIDNTEIDVSVRKKDEFLKIISG